MYVEIKMNIISVMSPHALGKHFRHYTPSLYNNLFPKTKLHAIEQ